MTPHPIVDTRFISSPINLLSAEVLANVFLLGLDESRIRSGWCRTVVNVCLRWRAVALSLPALWARIYVRTPADVREMPELLARAKNADMEVHIMVDRRLPTPQRMHSAKRMAGDALNCVIQHSSRITVFDYRVRHEDNASRLCALLDAFSADRLHTLTLETGESTPVYPGLGFGVLGGRAPVLRTLTTSIVPEDWGSHVFRQLRHFTLRLPPRDAGHRLRERWNFVMPDDLQRFLAHTPLLETLSIHLSNGYADTIYPFNLAAASTSRCASRRIQDISLFMGVGTEADFAALMSIVDAASLRNLALGLIPAPCGAALLDHLPPHETCRVTIQLVRTGIRHRRRPLSFDDWRAWTEWDICASSSICGIRRRFVVVCNEGLALACGTLLKRVDCLCVFAHEWRKICAALAPFPMLATEELVLRFPMARLHDLPTDARLCLPALARVVIVAAGPCVMGEDALRGIMSVLQFNAPRLHSLRFVNITLDMDAQVLLEFADGQSF